MFEISVNLMLEIIQLICACISLAGMIVCIRKVEEQLIFKLISEALVCFILGELYWVLHIYIKGYEQNSVFSISDISWIGFYLFLLTVCQGVFNQRANFKDKAYRKINLLSLIAPTFIISMNVNLYFLGDSPFYIVIYLIPTTILSYYTLRCILASFNNSMLKGFRAYHMTVGLILLVDNLVCLALDYGFEHTEYIFKFCFAMLLLCIMPTAYKGVREWFR